MPPTGENADLPIPDYESNESINTPPNEYTSLLPKPLDPEDAAQANSVWRSDEYRATRAKRLVSEFWKLTTSSVPVILAYTLQMSLQTATVIIIGHSSPMNLAVSAFSMMFALVTGWMIALGGTTALDTLASSTFTGSANKHDLGILLQRAFLVLGLLYIPVGVLWACSNSFFLALGQDPELSYQTSRFLTVLIPGGLGYIYFETMKKFLQAQGTRSPGHKFDRLESSNILLYRNNESRNVRFDDHIPTQRRALLLPLLHLGLGTVGRTYRCRNLILDVLLPLGIIFSVHRRFPVLGWVVMGSLRKPGDFRKTRHSGILPRWHRMVGI